MAFTFDEVFINNGQLVIANQDINPPNASGGFILGSATTN